MVSPRVKVIAALAVLFIVTALVAVVVLVRGTTHPIIWSLAAGVLSSLSAAMILYVISRVIAVDNWPPRSTSDDAYHPGLMRAMPKHSRTAREWFEFLLTARSEFYIAGHSLGRWCYASNQDEFKSHVRRILESKGRVTLVMLDATSPEIERLRQATSVDYTDRIDTSLRVLAELCVELEPSALGRLTISALPGGMMLPYMVVGNEQRLVTATYLGSTDSEQVTSLEFERSCDAAKAVYDDFHKLAAAGERPALPPVKPRADLTKQRARWLRPRR
jgi:hypothetical protein